jgi:hypothetical protein
MFRACCYARLQGSDIASLTSPAGILLQAGSVASCLNIAADPGTNYIVATFAFAEPVG